MAGIRSSAGNHQPLFKPVAIALRSNRPIPAQILYTLELFFTKSIISSRWPKARQMTVSAPP